MKSRLAMMALLVTGILMSGTGAGLAVTGMSSSGDASIAQYVTPPPCDANGDGVISPSEAAAEGCGEVEGGPDAKDLPTRNPTAREQAAQPSRQTEASGGDELPFTGFAAVPILVGGIGLLAGGLLLRRRTAAE